MQAAGVAGGGHYDDAGLPGFLNHFAKRVGSVGFADRVAERHVQDPDSVSRAVLDGPLDAVEDGSDGSGAVLVEDFDIDDVRGPANSVEGAVVAGAGAELSVAGDDSGDVGAMAVLVVGGGVAGGEADGGDDAASELGIGANAGIENGY